MIRQLDIRPGSMVVVTADLTRLALAGRRLEIGFDVDTFTDVIKQCLGKGGTLVIPAYNFTLRNNDTFYPARTLPITGAMAVAALKRPEFKRTRNPLHSFLAWGDQADALVSLDNNSSFAAGSPFASFREHHALMLLIDTSIADAFTFVHHVEELERVKYRRFKRINIFQEDGNGKTVKREAVIYAKKTGWTMDLKGLEKLLSDKNIAIRKTINRVAFTTVDLDAAFPVIQEDIRNNGARNIARFSLSLYFREMAKSILSAFGIRTLADKISHDHGLL